MARDRIMAGRDGVAVERVRVIEEIAELRKRVAPHTRNGCPAARILGDEVVDDVVPEAVLEIEHIVRDAQLVCDELRVRDRVERATRTVGHAVAVTEQLHRGADDLVPLFDEQRRGDGAVDAARHGNQHPHRWRTVDSDRTFSTIRGSTAVTASTSSTVLSLPKENRSAATPSSRGTPMAVSTCDGSTVPVVQDDADEQAMPARSRCISSAALSVPGIETFEMCGARSPCQPLITASGTIASSRRSNSSRSSLSRVPSARCSSAASRAATPSPTMPGTFSVPGRMPNCCPPPWMIASTALRSRTISAPTPLGAPILWPEMVRKVQLTSRSETGTLPNA